MIIHFIVFRHLGVRDYYFCQLFYHCIIIKQFFLQKFSALKFIFYITIVHIILLITISIFCSVLTNVCLFLIKQVSCRQYTVRSCFCLIQQSLPFILGYFEHFYLLYWSFLSFLPCFFLYYTLWTLFELNIFCELIISTLVSYI